jgi:hypothetical protein
MRFGLIHALTSIVTLTLAAGAPAAPASVFKDPLATPAAIAAGGPALLQQPLIALARIGDNTRVPWLQPDCAA